MALNRGRLWTHPFLRMSLLATSWSGYSRKYLSLATISLFASVGNVERNIIDAQSEHVGFALVASDRRYVSGGRRAAFQ